MSDQNIRQSALEYHRAHPPGKVSILPTKQLTNQRDLALAYTPGVAAACDEIVRDSAEARNLTARGNLIGVVTNGTAVLGLGAIGPLASKPVMEGKAVLFKKFAGLDCFDIEIAERDPDKLVDIICRLEPTLGGINLEDIKGPECFYVERKCRERMKIPVFHDDQPGTAIIVGAAVRNGLRVVGKDIAKVKLVCSGAGAAALACLDLLVSLGVKRENIWVSDIAGVVYAGRKEEMDDNKARYAQSTEARKLADIIGGADIFLGLSAARVLKPEMVKQMAGKPLILALANPEPEIMPAVAKAAMDSGVATRPITDFDAYHQRLLQFVYHSGLLMKPIFQAAKDSPRRIVFAEGEDERVLRAVQVVVDEGLAKPILVGRPAVIAQRIERHGLRLEPRGNVEVIDPDDDPRYRAYWTEYHRLMERRGITQQLAQIEMRRRLTLIGAMMIHLGDADGMLCGTYGTHDSHRRYIVQVLGLRRGVKTCAAMNAVILPDRTLFIADTYVNADPTAEQIVEITLLAAEEIRRFGITPKVALLSHSSFGSSAHPQAQKMQSAVQLINAMEPELEVDGEMHGDAALSADVRDRVFPNSRLKGDANLLIMPTLDAANISFNLLKAAAGSGLTLGPILLGVAKPAHILTPSATVRRIVNMTALTVVDANVERQRALL